MKKKKIIKMTESVDNPSFKSGTKTNLCWLGAVIVI